MEAQEEPGAVAYCGLVCSACSESTDPQVACPGCRAGGGEPDCRQRVCCVEQGIDGCWQCDRFPCDEGFATDGHEPGFRGFWIASVQCAREHGLQRYVAMVRTGLGQSFDHAEYRWQSAEVIARLLIRTTQEGAKGGVV